MISINGTFTLRMPWWPTSAYNGSHKKSSERHGPTLRVEPADPGGRFQVVCVVRRAFTTLPLALMGVSVLRCSLGFEIKR